MLVLSNGQQITENDLPDELRAAGQSSTNASLILEFPEEGISLEAIERELLLRALEKAGSSQSKAARYLDISRRTFIYRMEKHSIRPDGQDTGRTFALATCLSQPDTRTA